MSVYDPDAWVVVKIHPPGEKMYYRVLAGWYGGWAGSDAWKLSSGITKVVEHEHHFEVYNESGSVYNCHKETERMTGYTHSVFSNYKEQADKEGWVFEIVPLRDTEYGKNQDS